MCLYVSSFVNMCRYQCISKIYVQTGLLLDKVSIHKEFVYKTHRVKMNKNYLPLTIVLFIIHWFHKNIK